MEKAMRNSKNQIPIDPMVELILELAGKRQWKILAEIRNLIYQPFNARYHPTLFSALPDRQADVTWYSLRQTYRLIGPLMAGYPQTIHTGNFGRSLGELEAKIGQSIVERKLLIIRQSPRLHRAETTLLRLVTLMQDNNILINWNQLVADARFWNERTLNRWFEYLVSTRHRKEKME